MSTSNNSQRARTVLLGAEIASRVLVFTFSLAAIAVDPVSVIFVGPPLAVGWHFFRVLKTINDVIKPKGKKLKQGILYTFVFIELVCLGTLVASAAFMGNVNSAASDTNPKSDVGNALDSPRRYPYIAAPGLIATATAFQALLFIGAICLSVKSGYFQTVIYLPEEKETRPNPYTAPRNLKSTTAAGVEEIALK